MTHSIDSSPTAISGIEHIGVQVPDLDAALALFVDTLGFELVFRGVGPDGRLPVALLRCGGVDFEVFQLGDDPPRLEHIGLRTGADVVGAAGVLAEGGIPATSGEIEGLRGTRAVLLDQASTLGIRMHLATGGPE